MEMTQENLSKLMRNQVDEALASKQPESPIAKAIEQGQKPEQGQTLQIDSQGNVKTVDLSQEVTQEQSAVASIASKGDNMLGLGIPWGSVMVGAVPGIFVGDLIDGFVSPTTEEGGTNIANIGVKVGVGAAGTMYLSRYIGATPAKWFAGALVVQVASDLLPLDQWVAKVKSWFNNGGTAQGQE